jgi:hypothetical protein
VQKINDGLTDCKMSATLLLAGNVIASCIQIRANELFLATNAPANEKQCCKSLEQTNYFSQQMRLRMKNNVANQTNTISVSPHPI